MFVSTLALFLGVSSNTLLQLGHTLNLELKTMLTYQQVRTLMSAMHYFLIEGKAIPKGRPRVAMRGKFPHVYTPPTTRDWEAYVKKALLEAIAQAEADGKPYTMIEKGPVKVRLSFFFKKMPKADVDNLAKSVLDAANGILYKDDSQIVDLSIKKFELKDSEPSFAIGVGLVDEE